MKTLEYNIPIELPDQNIYNQVVKDLSGIIAHRKEDGKFYIKLMLKHYQKHANDYLKRLDVL